MPDQISWMFKANVTGGPSIGADGLLPIEAYDKVEVSVPKNDGTKDGSVSLAVQPPAPTSPASQPPAPLFLVISASAYPSDKPLKYQVGASTYTLDGPHILIGSGAVKLLGADLSKFTFTNPSGNAITVSILVGRNVSVSS